MLEVEVPTPFLPGWKTVTAFFVGVDSTEDTVEKWTTLASIEFFALPIDTQGTRYTWRSVPPEKFPTAGPWGSSVPRSNPVEEVSDERLLELHDILGNRSKDDLQVISETMLLYYIVLHVS